MSGRSRLPGGAPRKASQRKKHRQAPTAARTVAVWRPGDVVRWKGRAGEYQRAAGDDEHCEILLGSRVYRVPTAELE